MKTQNLRLAQRLFPTRVRGSFNGLAIVGAVATFAGATGLLAATGFLVLQAQFLLVGLPTPPLATTEYLRTAGSFLFDVVVLVILRQAMEGVLPAVLLALAIVGVWAAFRTSSPRRWANFVRCYARAWTRLSELYVKWGCGTTALWVCLIGLIAFTLYYHYPVFQQRNIFVSLSSSCSAIGHSLLSFPSPITALWQAAVTCLPERVRNIVLDFDRIEEAQVIYRNGVTWLVFLALCTIFHPYNQFRSTRATFKPVCRWLWSVTATLLFLSLLFLPIGYAVLFSQKQAPLVSVTFKDVKPEAAWQGRIRAKDWYLLFQNEHEMWLFRRPVTVILARDQVSFIETDQRNWFLSK